MHTRSLTRPPCFGRWHGSLRRRRTERSGSPRARAVTALMSALLITFPAMDGNGETPAQPGRPYVNMPHRSSIPVMKVVEPGDASWDGPLPTPRIPDPPKGAGLTDRTVLRAGPTLDIDGEDALAAEAAKEGSVVKGKGTEDTPYVIRDLRYVGLTDTPGIRIKRVKSHVVIENVLFDGKPLNQGTPADTWGLRIVDCENIVVRHCQVSRCLGMHAYGQIKNIRFDFNYGFSCDRTIFSGGGSHISAKGNYVRDALQYGVFLYNGTDNTSNRCSINGISLKACTGCVVQDNRVHTGVVTGITITGGGRNTVTGNSVADIMSRYWGGGITLRDTTGNTITHNTIERCLYGVTFLGKGNSRNVLKGTVYRDSRVKIAMRDGAEEAGRTNELDAEAMPR